MQVDTVIVNLQYKQAQETLYWRHIILVTILLGFALSHYGPLVFL